MSESMIGVSALAAAEASVGRTARGVAEGVAPLLSPAGGFGAALRRARSAAAGGTPEAARSAAEEFVAMTLVQPILAQMRAQNSAAAPFGPGEAERAFAPLWDAEIAARITKAENFGVVDAVARKLLERALPLPAQETLAHGA